MLSVDAGDCRPGLRYCGSTLSAIGINPASVPGLPDNLRGQNDRHKLFQCEFGGRNDLTLLIEQCGEFIFIKSAVQINESR